MEYIILKINVCSFDATQTMRFAPKMTVEEAAESISERLSANRNYNSLFRLKTDEWMNHERTLLSYELDRGVPYFPFV